MARTDTGAALTREHRRRQLAVRAATLDEFRTLWPVWDPSDLGTFSQLVTATVPLVQARRQTSAGVAVDYYQAFRVAEGVDGSPSPVTPSTIDRGQVTTSLEVTGQTQLARSLQAGFPPGRARTAALATMAGAVGRHVLNGGRDTIILSAESDRQARGRWRRITASDPCAFCALLASRGAVFQEDTSRFRAHDHCACTAEPAYPGSGPTDESMRWRQMYDRAIADAREAGELDRGTSNDLLNAFRRAYDNQT